MLGFHRWSKWRSTETIQSYKTIHRMNRYCVHCHVPQLKIKVKSHSIY